MNSSFVRQDDHDHDLENGTSDVIVAKSTAMLVLFLAAVLIGLLPIIFVSWLKWNVTNPSRRAGIAISMLLAFGGGVLLSTTFLHLLPEVRYTINNLQSTNQIMDTEFPLAELLMCCGFFLIYFISELVHGYIDRYNKQLLNDNANKDIVVCTEIPIDEQFQMEKRRNFDMENPCCDADVAPITTVTTTTTATTINGSVIPTQHQPSDMNYNHHNHHNHHHSHLHLPSNNVIEDSFTTSLRGLLIVLALSVHELFEGMALGLEKSAPSVWLFFGAIASHKLVLAFCVGVELLIAKTNRKLSIGYIILFAIVSPIGIAMGMIVSESIGSAIASAVLQAMATGTLVFVVFFEILKKSGAGLLQFLAVIVGFFIMFGLQQITGHNHSHGGEDGDGDDNDHGHTHNAGVNRHSGHDHSDHSHVDSLRQKINMLQQVVNELHETFDKNTKEKIE